MATQAAIDMAVQLLNAGGQKIQEFVPLNNTVDVIVVVAYRAPKDTADRLSKGMSRIGSLNEVVFQAGGANCPKCGRPT